MPRGRAGSREKTSPVVIETTQRNAQILQLRVQGYSQQKIADSLGLAKSTVSEIISTALDKTLREPADELRAIEIERLEALHRELLIQFHAAKGEGKVPLMLQVADRLLRTSERLSRVAGLELPINFIENTAIQIVPRDYRDALKSVMTIEGSLTDDN